MKLDFNNIIAVYMHLSFIFRFLIFLRYSVILQLLNLLYCSCGFNHTDQLVLVEDDESAMTYMCQYNFRTSSSKMCRSLLHLSKKKKEKNFLGVLRQHYLKVLFVTCFFFFSYLIIDFDQNKLLKDIFYCS